MAIKKCRSGSVQHPERIVEQTNATNSRAAMCANLPFAAPGINHYRENAFTPAIKHHPCGIGIGKEKIVGIKIAKIEIRIERSHVIAINYKCSMKNCIYPSI